MDPIRMDRKYQTRDGRPVRILCVDGPGPNPVVGFVQRAKGPTCWSATGVAAKPSDQCCNKADLIHVPEEVTRYANIYRDDAGTYLLGQLCFHQTAADAIRIARFEPNNLVAAAFPITFKVPS